MWYQSLKLQPTPGLGFPFTTAVTIVILLITHLLLISSIHGLPNCPSLQLRQSLILNPADNNLVCDCPKEGPGSGWEISCFKDPENGNGNSGPEFGGDYYYSIPIAFTVTYVEDKSITIHCYGDSYPNFKSAMFQGYGVDAVDTFKIFDCPLPPVPFSLIFHRTSIVNNKERNGKRPLVGNNGNHISVTRSLRIDSSKPLKIGLKHFKHLFYGLDSLEHLSLKNIQLVYDENGERVKRSSDRHIAANDSLTATTGASIMSSAINNSETEESHVPFASTTTIFKQAATIARTTGSTFVTSTTNNAFDEAKTNATTTTNGKIFSSTDTTTALPVVSSVSVPSTETQVNGTQRIKLKEGKDQKSEETKPSATRNEAKRTQIGNVTQAEKALKSSGEVSDMVKESSSPERNSNDEIKERKENMSTMPPPVRKRINFTLGQLFPKLKTLLLESFLVQDTHENSYVLRDLLPGLKFLENLDLKLNIIKTLPNNLLDTSGASLKRLYLLLNQIENIEPNAFAKLSSLEILDLTKNRIKYVPKNMLKDLSNLKYLRMVQNWFSELPESLLTQAMNLQALDLNQNMNLTSLPEKFLHNSNNLKNFSICDCNLTQLATNPSNFFRLSTNLERLEMRNNRLKNLTAPGLFAQNAKLNKIDLSYNDISVITPDIFSENSSSISELNLYGNNLVSLNEEVFFDLRNLRQLNLGFNNLNEVNLKIFHQLSNLEELNLSSNNLTAVNNEKNELPFGIGKQLKRINLSRNHLKDFNEFEIINWTLYLQLEAIDLSYNSLGGEIDIPVFYSTSDVDLNLSHNKINSVSVTSIVVHEQALVEESRSEKSEINEYRKLNTKLSRVTVFLRGNPLVCDCWLVPFIKYAKTASDPLHRGIINKVTFDIDSPDLMCAKPSRLENQTLSDVRISELTCMLEDELYCPSGCHCAFRSSDESVIVNCMRRGLKRIPEETIALAKADRIRLSLNRTVSKVAGITFKYQHNDIKSLKPLGSMIHHQAANVTKIRKRKSTYLDFYLDDNGIKEIPEDLFVRRQNLSSQVIEPVYIRILSLRNNRLTSIPDSFLEYFTNQSQTKVKGETEIYLGHNPYNCTPLANWKNSSDCVMRKFKSWLTNNYHLIRDMQDITCESLDYNSTSIITRIPDSVLCPHLFKTDQTLIFTLVVLVGVLSFLLLMVTVLYYRNKQTVLAFVYIHFQPIFICFNFSEDDLDEDKLYDAFISYSSADRDIVMQLIEKLEKPSPESHVSISYLESQSGMPSIHEGHSDRIVPELNTPLKSSKVKNGVNGSVVGDQDEQTYFKLCIHERDWLPGNLISWNIVNSVQNSRRTVLILSQEFIKSIWFQVEFHTAYYQMLEDKMDRLIVIVRGELPPKEELDKDLVFLLTTKTYLVWGEKWFWEKLRYALPHKRKGVKKDANLNFSTLETTKKKGQNKSDAMKSYVEETIANHFQLHTPSNLSQKKESVNENVYTPNPVSEKYQNNEKKANEKGVVNESFVIETET